MKSADLELVEAALIPHRVQLLTLSADRARQCVNTLRQHLDATADADVVAACDRVLAAKLPTLKKARDRLNAMRRAGDTDARWYVLPAPIAATLRPLSQRQALALADDFSAAGQSAPLLLMALREHGAP